MRLLLLLFLVTHTCTYSNNNIITLQNIDITDFPRERERERERESMLTLREKSPLLRRGSTPRRCITQDSEPNTLPTELFRPSNKYINFGDK